ncbi:archaea-specific SMC-related protein [Halarchaeum nitratireducens]|uniref:Chromosome segregation protein SMC n=1 Tax=Halarchaeum nitratireducens TaxID=489913 RepID=A0A830G9B6_9EURY|nr:MULTISPECIES: archaea-specific SMC-related protein [Halarchaeum]MBP2249802.1 chromosome segregation ATPase [Halarchaeum solikamskense]GGN10512.1 chromosome segregation protein SMC [Halarchaeum nitratireducens]
MQTSRETGTGVDVRVSNIGGIEETAVSLTPGVNVLVGRNATNRTSFLQSLMAVAGSERATLKGDSEEGRVEADLDGETFTRVLTRRGDGVDFSGDPIVDDAEVADLFAFLLEDNEARRAVATQGDLRELVMRPVDTEAINDRIDELVAERDRIDDEIENAEAAGRRIPDLEERRVELLDEIEAKREALEEKQAEIDDADADVDESREERDELEDALDDLNDRRAELDRIASRLENERSSLSSVRSEREDVAATLEELESVSEERADYLDEQVSSLRDRKRELDSTITQLQSLIQFNEEMLEGEHTEVLQLLADDEGGDGSNAVTDALLAGAESAAGRCWTCGSEVSMEEIEETLDTLRELAREKRQERSSVTTELEEVQSERNEIETRVERREDLEARLEELGEEIETREANVERLTESREEAADAVEDLEETVEELEAGRHSAVLDLHREANELQFELNDLQDDLEDIESEIASLEAEVDRKSELTEKRESIADELAELRTRIERLEAEAVESFNEHMETVLDVLDYGNVSRVWIERATEQVREGRRKVERTAFRLHVIRTGADGTAYEDTVEHLSESEREVIGLVFGLAGYLVHEVYEECPFMLLDSLEAIDSSRIAALVDYFHEYAPYIAVALLPEDAQALDDDYRRVTEI